ncbi:cupin domain-containing protein [Methanosphaerula palustris]|nr:cupin domain-containing protein [Methanosphaerula palustris]
MDNSLLCELIHPGKTQDDIKIRYRLAHVFVLKGESTLPRLLKNSAEVYYMIRGQGLMHIDEQADSIDAGQAVVIPAGSVQFISNTGEKDLEFLAIVDPMWDKADEICIPCNR